jgi:transposase
MPQESFQYSQEEEKPGKKKAGKGKPRIEVVDRKQIQMQIAALDDLLPEDHRARIVWEMVQGYDLAQMYACIEAIEGGAGRPAIDPQILMAVWLYATLEGVGSARELARLCEEHLAYKWLLGGITVNYHTLADFRVENEEALDQVLTSSVAALIREGIVTLERTAQDGMRIRASAGASSFRRKPTLEECLRQANSLVEELKTEKEDGWTATNKRKRAAQERHARERVERLHKALKEIEKIEVKKAKNRESKRKNRPARASATDPEARVMKMANGGFRPALNAQLSVDMHSRIIVGVEVSNQADQSLLEPMIEQIRERYGTRMKEHFVDGGFRSHQVIEQAYQQGIEVYSPIPTSFNSTSKKKPEEIYPNDGPGVIAWKRRMISEEAKQKYVQRAAVVEWANAQARNRNLYQLSVRGQKKARAVLLWHALANNLMQTLYIKQRIQLFAG